MGILAVGKEDLGKSGLGFRFGGSWNDMNGETTLKYTIFCCSEGTFTAVSSANEVAKCVFFAAMRVLSLQGVAFVLWVFWNIRCSEGLSLCSE